MTIGERIKKLRRQQDLTQEKLADFLCVSYQAVSKWECGISSPDLSLIGPLSKLLLVSADELLGLTEPEPDLRRTELEASYEATWQSGDLEKRWKIADAAVHEYPGEMKYLEWLAGCEHCLALECRTDDKFRSQMERAVRHYETVIENTDDMKIRCSAISGIVMSLALLNRREEGMKYAQSYPELPDAISKSELMDWLLDGQEKKKNRQERLDKQLCTLLRTLQGTGELEYERAICSIIKIIIPDGNYLFYHEFLFISHIYQAITLTNLKQYEEAVSTLETAYCHAAESARLDLEQPGIHRYTTPMLNLVEIDTNSFVRTGTGTQLDNFRSWLDSPGFATLRERKDFQRLAARLP